MHKRLVLVLILAACGKAADPGGGGGSGGSQQPHVDHCPDLAAIAIGAGNRFSVPRAGIDTATVASLPDGFAVLDESPGNLTLRASWDPGDFTLGLELHCGKATATAQVPVSVSPLRWTPLPTWRDDGQGPLDREYFSFFVDEADPDRAILYGGFHYVPHQFTISNDMWSLDLVTGAWKRLPDPLQSPGLGGGRVASIPGQRAMLWYGGIADDNTVPFVLSQLDYAADAPAFTPRTVTPTPSDGNYQPIWFYDEPRARYLAICGANVTEGYNCDVHSYDPVAGTWSTLETEGSPPAGRDGSFWVNDVENQRLVFFSGDRGAANGACDCISETWSLELAENPMRWVKLDLPDQPPGRRNGGYTLDAEGERLFLWGGTPDGAHSLSTVWSLDLVRGHEAWHKLDLPGEPHARTSDGALYDAPRHRILFGFGNDALLYTDMNALELGPAKE